MGWCGSILTAIVALFALAMPPQAVGQGIAPGYVATSPMLPIIYAMPVGSWAKVNQNVFQSVWTPEDLRPLTLGLISDPGHLISAWSGFAWDANRGDLMIFGGGHANYSGNDIYRWRSSTLMWERASLPSEVTLVSAPLLFNAIDGPNAAPIAAHTYQNNVFLPIADRFMTWGGASYNVGGAFTMPDENNPGQFRLTGPYLFDPAKADANKVGGTTGSHVQRVAPYPNILGAGMWENRDIYKNVAPGSPKPGTFVNGCVTYAKEGGHDVVYVSAGLEGQTQPQGRQR